MHKFFFTFAAVVASIISLCLPLSAIAGTQASTTRVENGKEHIMCPGVEGTGVCDNGLTNDIYAVVDMYDSVTFILHESGTSLAVCEIYATSSFQSTVTTAADISALGGDKINSTDLSDSQQKIQFNNIDYKYMWVSCSVLDASTTITMQGSVGTSRLGR